MLRDSIQVAFCGLVLLGFTACTSTRPLLSGNCDNSSAGNVRIKADPFVQYRYMEVLNRELPCYETDLDEYLITVTITEYSSSALCTSTQVAKDQLRMVANITVYNKDYKHIGSKVLDTYTTYEVGDELPNAMQSLMTQARISLINELARASALAIKAIVTS